MKLKKFPWLELVIWNFPFCQCLEFINSESCWFKYVVPHGVVYMMMIHGPVMVQFGSSYLDVVESLLTITLGFWANWVKIVKIGKRMEFRCDWGSEGAFDFFLEDLSASSELPFGTLFPSSKIPKNPNRSTTFNQAHFSFAYNLMKQIL